MRMPNVFKPSQQSYEVLVWIYPRSLEDSKALPEVSRPTRGEEGIRPGSGCPQRLHGGPGLLLKNLGSRGVVRGVRRLPWWR